LPTRYVPPSGFGYPLGGFLPAIPCRFCFAPAALMGFTLRSVLLSKGIRAVTTRMTPPTVSPIGAPAAVAVGRPNRPRFLGFNPFKSPWRPDEGLVRRPLDAPLGFYPFRVLSRMPCPRLPSGSSHALIGPGDESPCPPAPQSINRLPPGPIHMPHRSTFIGSGNPYEVFAPAQSRTFRQEYLRAMCSPHIVSCICRPANDLWRNLLALPESPGIG
jgi:hypothetical protein